MNVLAVFQPHRFARLVKSDALNISRDPTLIFASLMCVLPCVLAWYFWDEVNALVETNFGLQGFMTYMLPVVLCIPATLIGWVTGFLILEDRDDGPLMAVDITPTGKSGFMIYRASVTAAVSFLITVLAWWLLFRDISIALMVLIGTLIAIEAVIAALVLPAIARNKVEGLALTKVTNLISVLPPLLAIIPSPLRYLASVFPPYWIAEILAVSGTYYWPQWVSVVLAVVVHLGALVAVYHWAMRRAG